MKSILLTYTGLIAIAGGVFCALCGDPDALLIGVPLLIAGPILFIENLKSGIAKSVAEEMANREREGRRGPRDVSLGRDKRG